MFQDPVCRESFFKPTNRYHRFKLIGLVGYVIGILSTAGYFCAIIISDFYTILGTGAFFGFASSISITVLFNYIGELCFPNSGLSLTPMIPISVFELNPQNTLELTLELTLLAKCFVKLIRINGRNNHKHDYQSANVHLSRNIEENFHFNYNWNL